MKNKHRQLSLIFYIVLSTCFTSCASTRMSVREYKEWYEKEDHGLEETYQSGKLEYLLQYRPLSVMVLQELGNQPLTEELYDSVARKYESLHYFILRISAKEHQEELLKYGVNDYAGYQARIAYCLQQMEHDLVLEQSGREYPCLLYHFERSYNLSPYLTFLLAFDRPPLEEDFGDKILYFEDGLFNQGSIAITIKESAITNIPELIIK